MTLMVTSRKRNSSKSPQKSAKRRRTTKGATKGPTRQLTFNDDEGDKVVFRVNANGSLSEIVNGRTTLSPVTTLTINEGTGRVEDDDGPNDGFNLIEKERLQELKSLVENVDNLKFNWITSEIEMPVKPTPVVVSSPAKIEEPQKPAKIPTPTKPKRARRRRKSVSRTPRKPKVWDPITFTDSEGDKVTFTLTPEGFLQERVNDKMTLEKVTRMSINTFVSRIEDDDGADDGFTVVETDKLAALRDMAVNAMDLNLNWSTEEPPRSAFCIVM